MIEHEKQFVMELKIKKITGGLLAMLLITLAVNGQQPDPPAPQGQVMRNRLTDEQKTMLRNEIAKRNEIREAFKATLSQEQKNMLTDPRMTQAERIKTFRASLTDAQVNMIKTRQREMKAIQGPLRANLTQGQRLYLRRMSMNRTQLNRQLYRRARLRQKMGGI